MSKKSFYLPKFIDEKKFLSRHENHKIKNVVVYSRLSDDTVSMGEIKWFEHNKKNNITYVTLIDYILNSFQTCAYQDIVDMPTDQQLKKLKEKVAKYRIR
tara:strand:- start:882 stop:1181 length:300 start_codon:yes stop_codon:yes gene_type:complete